MKGLLTYILVFCFLLAGAQHEEDRYYPVEDPLVADKLEQWQDLKFGLLMHWGAYSQWGIVESWSLCPEEYGWCERKMGTNPDDYNTYVREYEDLKKTFNPVKFDPSKWAAAASEAGMKYVVFTTKHHDGFTMFDSKFTDYKITDEDCPFSANPRSDVTLEIFNAFRSEGLWAGAYFSKPDWHSPYYWDPKYPPRDRNVNYEPETNPEKWEQFIQFTHNQIMELMSDYGKVDILWLDGGWVAKGSKEEIVSWYDRELANQQNGYLKRRKVNQDIRMDELVAKAREKQPGLIVVDRAVPGVNQNYLTPENRVPAEALPFPWESCIISGGGWAHTKNAKYMSGHSAIQLLADIVIKGGNLLLNIAPTPDGEWQQGAYDLLEEYKSWMNINSEAIYGTRALAPYKEGKIGITQKDEAKYLYYFADENENTLPSEVIVPFASPEKNVKVNLLGTKARLKWEKADSGFRIIIPEKVRANHPGKYVWCFKVE